MHSFGHILQRIFWSKYTLRVAGTLLAIFILANAVIFFIFRDKTYPGTTVGGKQFGSVATASIDTELQKRISLSSTLRLQFDTHSITAKAHDLGIRIDTKELKPQALKRSWLPARNIIDPPHVPLAVKADVPVLTAKLMQLVQPHVQQKADARVAIQNGLFALDPAKQGKDLNIEQSKEAILTAVADGETTIKLAISRSQPAVPDQQIQPIVDSLRAQQNVAITFTFGEKTAKPSAADIASWFVKSGNAYELSEATVRNFVQKVGSSFGVSVANVDAAASAVKTGLNKQQAVTFALTAAPKATKTFTYCVQAKNVDASNLPAFRSKLASVYADARGWSANGKIAFSEVSSGCNFTVWLSASDQVPSFGAICDTTWSCSVKPHVIINFDRWRYASDAWSAAGGSLDNYRSMVINHETGHQLGFGHKHCGGTGQAAPVMQQQSISLQGCSFNPWPLASEQQQLLVALGIR